MGIQKEIVDMLLESHDERFRLLGRTPTLGLLNGRPVAQDYIEGNNGESRLDDERSHLLGRTPTYGLLYRGRF